LEEVILDTNILIEILKNNPNTIKELEKFDIHYISSITQMELFYGALNKRELNKLNQFINLFEVIPVSVEISNIATGLIYKYAKSHTLDIPDGLIAATSLVSNISLMTYNKKDFKYIENINIL
jgi:predicted nucleic acid-binding protein